MINGLVLIRIYLYRLRLIVKIIAKCLLFQKMKNMAKKVTSYLFKLTNYSIKFASVTYSLKTQSYARICGSQNGILHARSNILDLAASRPNL